MSGTTIFKNSIDVKKLTLLVLFLSTMEFTYSQKKFDLTFIASPQVSWLTSDSKYVKSDKGYLGFGYGVEGDIFLHSDNYLIVTGVTVNSVGGSLTYRQSIPIGGKELPAGTTVDYYLTNLEIPLALKMRTRNFNRVRYYAQFGFTNWFNLKTKATSNNNIFQHEVVRHEIRLYNIGLNIGSGIEYDLGHGNALTGGLVYSSGFMDSTNNTRLKDATTLNVLRLRLGFLF